ncbi:rhomboid family intramembrane serine protease [Spirochaetota bacterium]
MEKKPNDENDSLDKYIQDEYARLRDFKDNRERGYDNYDEEEEEIVKPKGPLSKFPSTKFTMPVVISYFIFVTATLAYNKLPIGSKLWASGEAVFGKHEYWRALTSVFTHADFSHLLSNTPLFFIFGWFLRAYFGVIIFPLASFLVGIACTLVTISVYEPHIRLLGASGMVYGMVALWLAFYVRYDIDHSVPMRIFRAVGFSLILLFPTVFDPRVSYLAHAVGFGVGLVFAILLAPLVEAKEPK